MARPNPLSSNGPERRTGRVVLSSSNVEKDDFLCKVKYLNRLPDLPADTKFLVYNVDMSQYVKYASTSLEKEYKRDINCDSDMGMKLNLLTMQMSREDPADREGIKIDQDLCGEEPANDQTPSKGPQRIDHGRHVAWLRKSQYILNDFAQNRGEFSAEKTVKRPVSNAVEFNLRTRAKRVEAIMETFEYAINKPKRHPNKPELTVVEESPVFPDFDLAKYPVVIVNFENDPAPPPIPHYTPDEVMASSMLRGMTDESGNQLVAYFVPAEETMQKLTETRGNVDDNEEYAYKLHREFALPEDRTRPQSNKAEDTVFAFNMRDGSMFYTELDTKVKLIRRTRGAKRTKSRLIVRFVSEVPVEPEAEAEPEAVLGANEEDEEADKTPPVVESDAAESSADEEVLSNGVPTDEEDSARPEVANDKEKTAKSQESELEEESAKSTSGSDSGSDSSDDAPVAKKKANSTEDPSASDSD